MAGESGVRLRFISGKGGVGKSSVAAAAALRAAQGGEKVLLAELGHRSFLGPALGLPVTNVPYRWRSGVDVVLWDGTSCLREYALHLLKSETLYSLFFENPVSKTLIQVAPGLAELAILGKITSGAPRNVGPKLDYDRIVIDCFASGHFLALLKAPEGFSQAIQVGPMAEQTNSILKTLRDPKLTEMVLVTLPEELPVQEALETESALIKLGWSPPKILLNRCWPGPWKHHGMPGFTDYLKHHELQVAESSRRLKGSHQLPWVLKTQFVEVVDQLADHLVEALP